MHIDGAHVSGIFHTTPEEVQGGFRTGEITVGAVNRMMVARLHPAASREITGEYPDLVFDDLTGRLADSVVRMWHRDPGEGIRIIEYTADASSLWSEQKPGLDTEADDEVGANILVRNAGHVARSALLYALTEGHERIQGLTYARPSPSGMPVATRRCSSSER